MISIRTHDSLVGFASASLRRRDEDKVDPRSVEMKASRSGASDTLLNEPGHAAPFRENDYLLGAFLSTADFSPTVMPSTRGSSLQLALTESIDSVASCST